jgi:GT2 family glycosyltransferase
MLFSVVIPTFNRRELLQKALGSVWSQSYQDYEVIVVDDGSHDGTREYLDGQGSRLTAVLQDNRGPGAARNAGVARARGEYVAFLDSDDLWFPWTLQTFASVIRQTGEPAMVIGAYTEFSSGDAAPVAANDTLLYERFDDYFGSADRAVATGAGTAVVKRTLLVSSGGFTPQRVNCEDHDLALRLGERPGFVAITAPPTLAWRRHSGTLTGSLQSNAAGARYLLSQERAGNYPGGRPRAAERRKILTRHTRPISLAALREFSFVEALELYAQTFRWHLAEPRFRYLAWFAVAACAAAARRLLVRPGA